MTMKLRTHVSRLRTKSIKAASKEITKASDTHIKLCRGHLSSLVTACDDVSSALKAVSRKARGGATTLNTAYAARVLQWIEKTPCTPITLKGAKNVIAGVDREIGKQLCIRVRRSVAARQSKRSVQRVLQERLIIEEVAGE